MPWYRRIGTGRWDGTEDQVALDFRSPAGQECIELAEEAHLDLDIWQQLALHHSLAEDDEGLWASLDVVLNVARQNGKGGFLEARQLGEVILFGGKLVIHTAHQFNTALESFLRLDNIFEGASSLSRRVRKVCRTHGEEGFEFFSGARIRFMARGGDSGRGFSGDLVIMDEAMKLRAGPIGVLMPVLSARPNPQLVYTGSAGLGAESEQLALLRARALAEGDRPDESLTYIEHSVDPHIKECERDVQERIVCTEHDDRDDEQSWARANPALGIRIRPAYVRQEIRSMRADIFDRERLGSGDYPAVSDDTWSVIPKDVWDALTDPRSRPDGVKAFGVDMTPERSHTSISVAVEAGDAVHLEVVENRPGSEWTVERAAELNEKWRPRCWVIDPVGPAGSLIKPLRDEGLTVVTITARQMAQACGAFYDEVKAGGYVHLGQAPLATALAGAQKRELGDAWAWARKIDGVDISPLVAVTEAAWGLDAEVEEDTDPMDDIW
ncbi:terminase [Streptomyces phaeochromogenes]|uniref:terminase n=1 Tax=Streptomyces phaeochromogenes TaxID=1923 RepID=UPI003697C38C